MEEKVMVTFSTTTKGRPMAVDANNYRYVGNATAGDTKYWKCCEKKCNARIRTSISTSTFIGDNLPEHTHENLMLKQRIVAEEVRVIKKWPEWKDPRRQ